MLNWNNDEEIQKKGIEQGMKIEDISKLVQPVGSNAGKCIWENCARIIYMKSDKELETYLHTLLEWLQDSNWPGFDIICKRIKNMESKIIANIYFDIVKKAINQSLKEKNDEWLINLLEFADNKVIYESLSENERNIVSKHIEKYRRTLEERKKWYKNIEENYFPNKLEIIDNIEVSKLEEIFSYEYENTFNKVKEVLPDKYKKEIYEKMFKYYLHNTKMILSTEILNKILDVRLLTLGKVSKNDYEIIKEYQKKWCHCH